jgi:hypothetical protein
VAGELSGKGKRAKTHTVVFILGHQIKSNALSLVIIQPSEFYAYLIALNPFEDCFYFNLVSIIAIEQEVYLDHGKSLNYIF